ncbi:MAG TPA: hypothetical protein V6D17_17235, partial [Candidatus Obscuribacterales bacterium]
MGKGEVALHVSTPDKRRDPPNSVRLEVKWHRVKMGFGFPIHRRRIYFTTAFAVAGLCVLKSAAWSFDKNSSRMPPGSFVNATPVPAAPAAGGQGVDSTPANLEKQVTELEKTVFGPSCEMDGLVQRISRLENKVLRVTHSGSTPQSLSNRVQYLWQRVFGASPSSVQATPGIASGAVVNPADAAALNLLASAAPALPSAEITTDHPLLQHVKNQQQWQNLLTTIGSVAAAQFGAPQANA